MRTHPAIIKSIMAVAFCALIFLVPVPAIHAQGVGGALKGAAQGTEQGVQKGANAVGQGAEGVYNKGKEGTEAVGHGIQHAVTPNQNRNEQQQTTTTQQTAPTTGNAAARTGGMQTPATGQHNLPRTAGELPLLALIAASCFAALGVSRVSQKRAARARQ